MSANSSATFSWKDVSQWIRVVVFLAALSASANFAVRLGGTAKMEPWLLLVFAMLAGRLLHYLLPVANE